MADTRKNTPAAGKEYWKSRLHRQGEKPGRDTKRRAHRKERRAGKKEIDDA